MSCLFLRRTKVKMMKAIRLRVEDENLLIGDDDEEDEDDSPKNSLQSKLIVSCN